MDEYMDAIENISKIIPKEVEGDYRGADGLLYCGKCNTRKEMKIHFDANTLREELNRIQPILCKCETEKAEETKKKIKQQEHEKKVHELRDECFDEVKFKTASFESNEIRDEKDAKITKALLKYADNFEKEVLPKNMGLILHSSILGNGKSYYAAAIANKLIEREIPVRMTNFISIANESRASYSDGSVVDDLMKYALLIIDDLGTEQKNEYTQVIAYDVINSRYNSRLPVILTTNLPADDIKYPKGLQDKRIYSRLLEMCHMIEITGDSRRVEKYKKRHDGVNQWLGL